MTHTPTILAFAGATREQSWNKKLIRLGAEAAEAAGAKVTLIDLRDFPMPIYDGDAEAGEGLPVKARELKALLAQHEGLLLSCPEYNSSITALLKNTIDWLSRPAKEPSVFKGKVAALLAASPSQLGGARALITVRQVLTAVSALVLPTQFALPHASAAFTDDGKLKEEAHRAAVANVAGELVRMLHLVRPVHAV